MYTIYVLNTWHGGLELKRRSTFPALKSGFQKAVGPTDALKPIIKHYKLMQQAPSYLLPESLFPFRKGKKCHKCCPILVKDVYQCHVARKHAGSTASYRTAHVNECVCRSCVFGGCLKW